MEENKIWEEATEHCVLVVTVTVSNGPMQIPMSISGQKHNVLVTGPPIRGFSGHS